MVLRNWILRMVAVAVATVAVGSSSQAGLLPVSVTVTPEANNFRWTYSIVLPTDMKLQSGNYFTIYDFAGYVPGGEVAPDGWSLSAAPKGGTPDRLRPNDDESLMNLTWKYVGPTIPSGQIGLGNFWAISTFEQQAEDFFTAETTRTSDGLVDRNITDTVVPTGIDTPPPVDSPEPATLALAGLGLPLVGFARWMRRRKKA